jgi:hypothetical protein
MTDAELMKAVKRLPEIAAELDRLYDEHGDDADRQPDYRDLEIEWFGLLDMLAKERATKPEGMIAKASALLLRPVYNDIHRHSKIGASLAQDVLKHFGA